MQLYSYCTAQNERTCHRVYFACMSQYPLVYTSLQYKLCKQVAMYEYLTELAVTGCGSTPFRQPGWIFWTCANKVDDNQKKFRQPLMLIDPKPYSYTRVFVTHTSRASTAPYRARTSQANQCLPSDPYITTTGLWRIWLEFCCPIIRVVYL